MTGIQIKLPDIIEHRDKITKYILSACSFNFLPVNYLEIVEDNPNEQNVLITQKCYIKGRETYFTRSTSIFWTILKDVNLEELGLIKSNKIIPQVLRKRHNITNKLSPFTLKEINPIPIMYVTCAKKRKLEIDETVLKIRKLEYLEKTTALKDEYKYLLANERIISTITENLINEFKSMWKNLDTHGFYKISAFAVNDKGKYPIVGALAEKDGIKNVYYIKGYYKNLFINAYNTREKLKEDG